MFYTHEKPSTKHVQDPYIRLKERRRDEVRENEGMSGNVETVSDLDVLLGDLTLERNEF